MNIREQDGLAQLRTRGSAGPATSSIADRASVASAASHGSGPAKVTCIAVSSCGLGVGWLAQKLTSCTSPWSGRRSSRAAITVR